MLTDKIMDAVHGERFEGMVTPDTGGDPHILSFRMELMLATGPREVTRGTLRHTPDTTTPPPAAPAPTSVTPAYMTDNTADGAAGSSPEPE